MVNVQGVIIITSRYRWLKVSWTADSEQLEETSDGNEHAVAIFLHLQRLPFHNGGHRTLNPRLIADDAVDLFWLTVTDR